MQVLVIGGSLGATTLNRLLPEAISRLDVAERPRIKHQCGVKHLEVCQQQYRQARVEADVSGFI